MAYENQNYTDIAQFILTILLEARKIVQNIENIYI